MSLSTSTSTAAQATGGTTASVLFSSSSSSAAPLLTAGIGIGGVGIGSDPSSVATATSMMNPPPLLGTAGPASTANRIEIGDGGSSNDHGHRTNSDVLFFDDVTSPCLTKCDPAQRTHPDPAQRYAAPLTLDACRCPHLDALMPRFLTDLSRSALQRRHLMGYLDIVDDGDGEDKGHRSGGGSSPFPVASDNDHRPSHGGDDGDDKKKKKKKESGGAGGKKKSSSGGGSKKSSSSKSGGGGSRKNDKSTPRPQPQRQQRQRPSSTKGANEFLPPNHIEMARSIVASSGGGWIEHDVVPVIPRLYVEEGYKGLVAAATTTTTAPSASTLAEAKAEAKAGTLPSSTKDKKKKKEKDGSKDKDKDKEATMTTVKKEEKADGEDDATKRQEEKETKKKEGDTGTAAAVSHPETVSSSSSSPTQPKKEKVEEGGSSGATEAMDVVKTEDKTAAVVRPHEKIGSSSPQKENAEKEQEKRCSAEDAATKAGGDEPRKKETVGEESGGGATASSAPDRGGGSGIVGTQHRPGAVGLSPPDATKTMAEKKDDMPSAEAAAETKEETTYLLCDERYHELRSLEVKLERERDVLRFRPWSSFGGGKETKEEDGGEKDDDVGRKKRKKSAGDQESSGSGRKKKKKKTGGGGGGGDGSSSSSATKAGSGGTRSSASSSSFYSSPSGRPSSEERAVIAGIFSGDAGIEEYDEDAYDKEEEEQRWRDDDEATAMETVERYLEVIRRSRNHYWDRRQLQRRRRRTESAGRVSGGCWGALTRVEDGETAAGAAAAPGDERCAWCRIGNGGGGADVGCTATGDALIRCLECSAVGCGPGSVHEREDDDKVLGCGNNSGGENHILRHFLVSGHDFGVTCGPRAEIFCMRCGDFVYHEAFDAEKERVDVSRCMPELGWKENTLRRSFDPLTFVSTPDHGCLWRGLMATYPASVPSELAMAGRLSLKRLGIFRGNLDGDSLAWGPKALELAIRQRKSDASNWRIVAPIGMYNLGNTCFMSCVLQCLVNCTPLQRYFLHNVGHHYQACEALRKVRSKGSASELFQQGQSPSSKSKKGEASSGDMCLSCEMDRLFLRYFGSTIGIDAIAALEELPLPTARFLRPDPATDRVPSGANQTIAESPHQCFSPRDTGTLSTRHCGHPIIPSRLLTAAWKSGGMKHLAGYEQRDAHEFLQGFLDTLGKHSNAYYILAEQMSVRAKPKQIKKMTQSHGQSKAHGGDIVKQLFQGTLRSVLICETCGCKRSQPEPFLNISLPLAKELSAVSGQTTSPVTRTRAKISVELCLEHFTFPESLSDPVHCPSCGKKTPTQKQHTFAKLPRILVLHLKRFDASRNKKIADFVAFPAHGLDMGSHLPHWCEVMEGEKTSVGGTSSAAQKNGAESPRILYDLFGTVNHTGTLHQGHYVSNVKVDGQWYHCNDEFVCKAGEGDGEKAVLQSDGAYMLFYVRR